MSRNLTTVVKSSKKEVRINRDDGMVIIGERINPTGAKYSRQNFEKAGLIRCVGMPLPR